MLEVVAMKLTGRQISELRGNYSWENHNEDSRLGFINALKALGVSDEQIEEVTNGNKPRGAVKMDVKGEVGGKEFTGKVVNELSNGKLHIEILTTESGEWNRDIERGYPVIISVKKNEVTYI